VDNTNDANTEPTPIPAPPDPIVAKPAPINFALSNIFFYLGPLGVLSTLGWSFCRTYNSPKFFELKNFFNNFLRWLLSFLVGARLRAPPTTPFNPGLKGIGAPKGPRIRADPRHSSYRELAREAGHSSYRELAREAGPTN